MDTLFVVAAPGLAPVVAQELRRLGLLPAQSNDRSSVAHVHDHAADDEHAGVEFEGDRQALYRANLYARTANRVLVRLGEFEAVGFAELRKRASRLAWERYLVPGKPIALRVSCHKSRLYHSDAVAERVAGAIGARLGQPSVVQKFDEQGEDKPPQLVLVRLLHDHCTISLDSSGALLHRRGYRLATAKAPLRENLAAAMLLAAGWGPATSETPPPLIDPFCGAGTIAIEAAQLAMGIAPGHARPFAFMDWPDFDRPLWNQLLSEAEQQSRDQSARLAGRLQIFASDRDAGAIEMAVANAERAGVANAIEFTCQAVSSIIAPAACGWVVTNPPYGVRVSANKDLRNLYAQFGKVLRSQCPGWQLALLCNDRQLLGQLGIRLDTSLSLVNGGIAVKLARGVVG